MTIYTVMPEEIVFEGWQKQEPRYMELTVNGTPVQVELLNELQARIVRIYSTNPNDYLKPQLAPGTLIQFQPFQS